MDIVFQVIGKDIGSHFRLPSCDGLLGVLQCLIADILQGVDEQRSGAFPLSDFGFRKPYSLHHVTYAFFLQHPYHLATFGVGGKDFNVCPAQHFHDVCGLYLCTAVLEIVIVGEKRVFGGNHGCGILCWGIVPSIEGWGCLSKWQ